MINKQKIFDLLDLSFNRQTKSLPEAPQYNIDFLKIKMFVKLIEGKAEFGNKISKSIGYENKELCDNMIFSRAFYYIETLKTENIILIAELNNIKNRKEFIYTLDQAIKYFEKYEEYEKCAFLFRILTVLKEKQFT